MPQRNEGWLSITQSYQNPHLKTIVEQKTSGAMQPRVKERDGFERKYREMLNIEPVIVTRPNKVIEVQ